MNCAGLGTFAPVVAHPVEEWRTVVDICLTGVFLSVKHEAPAMARPGGGAIVNIASINAKVPAKGLARTAARRPGSRCSPRSRRWSSVPTGVRVAGDRPGLRRHAAHRVRPHGARRSARATSRRSRWAGPAGREDIADAALFLVSDEASWVSGETLYVDGAESTFGYPDLGAARATS